MNTSCLPSKSSLTTLLSARSGAVIGVLAIAGASAAFSLALACATPFAALATVAALTMRRPAAALALLLAWAANQAVGFGLLGYPHDAPSYAWGGAIGLSAILALCAATAVETYLQARSPLLRWPSGFAAAVVAWHGALHLSALAIGNGDAALSASVVGYVLEINLLALALFAGVHRVARMLRAGTRAHTTPAIA